MIETKINCLKKQKPSWILVKTEFTKEEYDVINKDLQKIFSSFKK